MARGACGVRREGDHVYVDASDAATLEAIAAEFGLTVPMARRLLELGDEPAADELLRPRVAALYRLAVESLR